MPTPPPDDIQYLDLADYLTLAGAALDLAPEAVFDVADLGLAESALYAPAAAFGAVEFCPDLVTKARVLVVHLTRNHALPDGNKRAAYLAMLEFWPATGAGWWPPTWTRRSTWRWRTSVAGAPHSAQCDCRASAAARISRQVLRSPRYTRRRSLAQRVSSWRLESWSLRSTDETWVSTVFTDRCSRRATSL